MDLRFSRQGEQLVHDLLDGLGRDLPATSIAFDFADPGKEEPQVVVDLSYGADCGAGVLAGAFLLDRDRR